MRPHGDRLNKAMLPDSSRRSPKPSLHLSSIAAPTTADDFLQVSLSKMPRSNLSLHQHRAPRHFRSRLTTSRQLDLIHLSMSASAILHQLGSQRPLFSGEAAQNDFAGSSIAGTNTDVSLVVPCEG